MNNNSLYNPEALLVDHVKHLNKHRDNRHAVYIALSKLQPYHRRDHHIRMASNIFEALVKKFDGFIFLLSNSDIVFIAKGVSPTELDDATLKLRFLFSEDRLIQQEEIQNKNLFSKTFNVEKEYDELFSFVQQLENDETKRQEDGKKESSNINQAEKEDLKLEHLLKIEQSIKMADISNIVRRQPISVIDKNNNFEVVFHEVFVSMKSLQDTLLPNVEILSNRWLFQYLTTILDKRMLSFIASQRNNDKKHFISLNMNISTILTQEFLDFDNKLSKSMRNSIIFEFQHLDILSDFGSYMFVRDFLHEKGYRISLDGLSHQTLPLIDREQLGFDFLKVFWSREFQNDLTGKRIDLLKEKIRQAGIPRLILARCEVQEALEFGKDLGFALFQGFYIDDFYKKKNQKTSEKITMREAMARGKAKKKVSKLQQTSI